MENKNKNVCKNNNDENKTNINWEITTYGKLLYKIRNMLNLA